MNLSLRIRALILPFFLVLLAATGRIYAQSRVYGTTFGGNTFNGGVLFSVRANGTDFQVLHDFKADGSDGVNLSSGVIAGNDGKLYGMTIYGGTANTGIIYSYDTASGSYEKLVDFTGPNGAIPNGRLLLFNNKLYGLTSTGGANGTGVLFSYDPASGTQTDLVDLDNTVGNGPTAGLTLLGGKLYFVNPSGGVNGSGTIAVFDPISGIATDLYDFVTADGASADLIVVKNLLYGTAVSGGANGGGYLFSFDPSALSFTDLYDLNYPTGISPYGITQYDGMIYGTAVDGGTDNGGGVVFSFNPTAGMYKVLHAFDYTKDQKGGGYPDCSPLITDQGQLLATTSSGGTNNLGIMFSFDLLKDKFQKLLEFAGDNGANPGQGQLLLPFAPATGTLAQTIQFGDINKTYGDGNFDGGGTAGSGAPIDYSSSDLSVATPFGNTVRIVGAGVCTLTASQRGNDRYAAAPAVKAKLTVAKAPLKITADNKTVYQSEPLPDLSYRAAGFVYGDTVSSLIAPPSLASTATSSDVQGSYPITASGAITNNYSITYIDGVLSVLGLRQTFTLTDSVQNYGDPDFSMAISSSGLPVTYSVDSADIAKVSVSDSTLLHITGAGLTKVVAIQRGNNVYGASTDTLFLRINKATLTITAQDAAIVYGEPAPPFVVSYQGFVNGEHASNLIEQPMVSSTASGEHPYPGTYLTQAYGAISQNYTFIYVSGLFLVSLSGDSLNAYSSSPGILAVNILSTVDRKAQLIFLSLTGQRVLVSELSLHNGFNPLFFPVGGLAAGIYIVKVEGSGMRLSQKVKVR